jgi:hypothetical protein
MGFSSTSSSFHFPSSAILHVDYFALFIQFASFVVLSIDKGLVKPLLFFRFCF